MPTCGLDAIDERLTLDPFEIVAVHPHDQGVSPGHSGVLGETLMLMSRKRTKSADELLCCLDYLRDSNAEVFVDLLVGSGCAKAMKAECDTIVADPLLPGHRM